MSSLLSIRRELSDISSNQSSATVDRNLLVLIEYLHPHKGVENQSRQLVLLAFTIVRQDRGTTKEEDESDGELINCLADNHLPHCQRDQWC